MDFSLRPFGPDAPAVTITGELVRSEQNHLRVRFLLAGAVDQLRIAPPAEAPERRDLLWETTCLEFFLGIAGASNYFEFNLSPTGHWNVYAFDRYREGMRPVETVTELALAVEQTADAVTLALVFDLGKLVPEDQALDVAVTAVTESADGTLSYWALDFPEPRADFHLRRSFVGRL